VIALSLAPLGAPPALGVPLPLELALTVAGALGWASAAAFLVVLMAMVVALVTDDRDPTTVIAWLLVIVLLPVFGAVLYFFIGRNYRRNTPARRRLRIELDDETRSVSGQVLHACAGFRAETEARLTDTAAAKLATIAEHVEGTPILPADSVEIYLRGEDKFRRLLEDLRGARRYIHLMYLIWERDELTAKVTDVLLERLRQGVEVRILYDWVSCLRYKKDELKRLAAAGAQVKPCFKHLWQVNYRNHMKIAIVDGELVYTGGMNMGQEYIDGGPRFASWRDTSVRLTGSVVAPFELLFAVTWRLNKGHEDLATGYVLEAQPHDHCGGAPVQVLHSSVATTFKSIRDAYIVALLGAEESVWIQSPYFVPDEPLLTAMCTAALAGTDVRLMMTGVPDKKMAFWAAHAYYGHLLESGVRIHHYMAGFLHAKTVTVDGRWCVIGTCNWDIRSMILHEEVSCVFYDEAISARHAAAYEQDLQHCREFTRDDWEALGRRVRLRNSFARLFSRLL